MGMRNTHRFNTRKAYYCCTKQSSSYRGIGTKNLLYIWDGWFDFFFFFFPMAHGQGMHACMRSRLSTTVISLLGSKRCFFFLLKSSTAFSCRERHAGALVVFLHALFRHVPQYEYAEPTVTARLPMLPKGVLVLHDRICRGHFLLLCVLMLPQVYLLGPSGPVTPETGALRSGWLIVGTLSFSTRFSRLCICTVSRRD